MNIDEKEPNLFDSPFSWPDLQPYFLTQKLTKKFKRKFCEKTNEVRERIRCYAPIPKNENEKRALDFVLKSTYVLSEMVSLNRPVYFNPKTPPKKKHFF